MESHNVSLSAPWYIFYKEIRELFGNDKDVTIKFDEENLVIKLYVSKVNKADALTRIMPQAREFGNVMVKVEVIPPNDLTPSTQEIFEDAFRNNPVFRYATSIPMNGGYIDYVVFDRKVVQYYNDDISDIHGNCSTLYQDIAKDVLGGYDGVNFCTASVVDDM